MSTTEIQDSKGMSLARGPALILGTVLLVAGLYFLYKLHKFASLSQFPSGRAHVEGDAFLGVFGVNGWSGELTAVAGGLLLFGAAQHLVAKTMSLIVAVIFAVVAVIALVHHHSALGLFAANIWTIILWGGSAAILLVNALAPRVGSRSTTERYKRPASQAAATAPRDRSPASIATGRTIETDSSTIIPARRAVRVRPTSGSNVSDGAGDTDA